MRIVKGNQEEEIIQPEELIPVNENTETEPSMEETEDLIEETDERARRKCVLSEEMVKMLVTQLGAELSNKHLYRTFADYYATQSLPELEKYFIKRAEEEENHHDWIYHYLTESDAVYQYPEVKPIRVEIKDRVQPFLDTVDREIETTINIYKIVDKAMEEKDWGTFNFLMGDDPKTGRLVREQREEESISRKIARLASEDTDWLTKQDTILKYYDSDPD